MHGGISKDLVNVSQLKTIKRPCEIPDTGLVCDLVWSDPSENAVGFGPNERGVSCTFSPKVLEAFLDKNDFQTAVLFGDGASSCVISNNPKNASFSLLFVQSGTMASGLGVHSAGHGGQSTVASGAGSASGLHSVSSSENGFWYGKYFESLMYIYPYVVLTFRLHTYCKPYGSRKLTS